MKKIRKQHFVPRFYLENFTFDSSHQKIYCYDKVKDKSYPCNISDVGQENDYYEIQGVTTNQFEKSISIFEGSICAPAYKKLLVNHDFNELTPEDKQNMFNFLAFQHIRSNDDRNSINELFVKIKDEFVKLYGRSVQDHNDIKNLEKQKALHLATIFNENTEKDIQKKTSLFLSKKWFVLSNEIRDKPFLISDNPLAVSSIYKGDNVAFMLKGSKIYFPLTSNMILYSFEGDRKSSGFSMTEAEINEANIAQIKSCTRFIYQNNNNFDFVQKFLSKNPTFRQQYRDKYVVSIKDNILTTKLKD